MALSGDAAARLREAAARFRAAAGGSGRSGGTRLTITDDSKAGGKGFDRIFTGLDRTLNEFPDVLRETLPTIRAAHEAVFTSEGAEGRGAWAGLSSWTLRERARLGYGAGPILVRSGALKAHVLAAPAEVTRAGRETTLRIEPDVSVGGVPKYRILAKGGTTSLGTTIPPRPMVAVGPGQATRITSAISRNLRARAAANGVL